MKQPRHIISFKQLYTISSREEFKITIPSTLRLPKPCALAQKAPNFWLINKNG